MKYLNGYPESLRSQVQQLMTQDRLGPMLLKKYPQAHGVRTDKALYDYVMGLKNEFLRSSEPLAKVAFDSKLHVIAHALGTHTTVSRVQGSKLKTSSATCCLKNIRACTACAPTRRCTTT